jgi:hypothetical protein
VSRFSDYDLWKLAGPPDLSEQEERDLEEEALEQELRTSEPAGEERVWESTPLERTVWTEA